MKTRIIDRLRIVETILKNVAWSGAAILLALTMQLQTGGALLIDLNATKLNAGPLDTWPNAGTVSGDFISSGDTVPEVVTIDGVKAVKLIGGTPGYAGTHYLGPVAPPQVTGNSSRTIEAWVFDTKPQDEKTVFAWGRRGGPDGSNCTFGHGTHLTWGAVGQWGAFDLGYGTNIIFGRWTYIVYTYDATTRTATTYCDGQYANSKIFTAPLATWDVDAYGNPLPFRIGRQSESSGLISDVGVGEIAIAIIRVHDVALSPQTISATFNTEKSIFGLDDSDNDGIPSWWERRYGLNENDPSDAGKDKDNDGLSNLNEYLKGTDPTNPDTDADGLKDGVETNTGVWTSSNDTGTDPLNPDTDGDGLPDGVETNTGIFVNSNNTGTNPLLKDTDSDGFYDYDEIILGFNPCDPNSKPQIFTNWVDAIKADNPLYWWRFENQSVTESITNYGSANGFSGSFGDGITDADLKKESAAPGLGYALEFTGPAAGNTTTKYVWFGAPIPELVNLRSNPEDGKATTVEYWFKSNQRGTHGNNAWQSPAILGHESPGDGDMYWGWINAAGDFGFSTSDIHDCTATGLADGQWHHVVMVKIWYLNQPCISRMYIDGGASVGGVTIEATTGAGSTSFQDDDGQIEYLGFVQSGELENVQFIGLIDEVVIYNKALTEAQAKVHYLAAKPLAKPFKILSAKLLNGGIPTISWEAISGMQYTVQKSTELSPTANWTDILTVIATNTAMSYSDTSEHLTTPVFYRIKQ